MAPEQCRGQAVDHRADVFALAVVAYRALTGRPPFSGPDHYAVIYALVNEQPPRPSDFVPLPADVDAALALGLAKDRDERFATAEEFASALSRAAHNALGRELRERAARLLARVPWSEIR
jgi:serine/threonine-protein kinase